MDARALPCTLAQRRLQTDRPSVFAQQVSKRFIRQFLELHHAVAGKQIKGLPRLVIELHAFSWHVDQPRAPPGLRSDLVYLCNDACELRY